MPKPKGAGDLRHRVKFQRRAKGDDEYGNPVKGWVDLGIERAASLTPTRGGEEVQAGRVAGKASWDCWVRNDSGTRAITTGDLALDRAVVEIAAVDAAEREAAVDIKANDEVLFAKGHTFAVGDVVALEAAGLTFVKVRSHSPFNIRFIGDMDGDRTWLLMQLESGGAGG
jgi:head-tail adaptor